MYRIAAALAALALASSAAPKNKIKLGPDDIGNGNNDPGKGVNFYSIEKEIALGHQMAEEVRLTSRLCTDPMVTEYVNRVGQNVARNSDAKVPFTIQVIDSPEVNAFALPGGFLFVNTGLVMKAENEAELAGVLAHEIAHVAARHGTKQATRSELVQYAAIPLVMFGGTAGTIIYEAATFALPLEFLHFSRAMENQADHLGVQYLYKTGYDPGEFINFFEKVESLERKHPGTLARAFSSHPMTNDRIHRAQQEIDQELQPREEYIVDTSEFQAVRSHLQAIEERRKGMDLPYTPALRPRPGIQ
ncbi:MAG TPA: M48 family metallopeptidase [Bryobacteraceae bacterium]|jgi:predicted Zn-dependent protease|nr:M48 family metallopeptidase [Bryobacteraceae bacterium]